MTQVSRRAFLREASVGAAAVGVAVTVPAFIRGRAKTAVKAPEAATTSRQLQQTGPIVAHIDDANSGVIHLMSGTTQVTYHNRELAQQLLQASS